MLKNYQPFKVAITRERENFRAHENKGVSHDSEEITTPSIRFYLFK